MIRGLIIIGTLLAATAIAHFMMEDRGYVLINFQGYAIEMSVPMLFLLAIAAYVGVQLVVGLFSSVRSTGRAYVRYRQRLARDRLSRGLLEVSEGNYARGERLLAGSADQSENPVLNYLGAARAAQQQGDTERRDNWLMLAYERDDTGGKAVLLTQAELQIEHGEYERALASLRKLEEIAPGHPHGLALLATIYRELGDWEGLRELLGQLRKRRALPTLSIDRLSQETYTNLLQQAGDAGASDRLKTLWQQVPARMKQRPELMRHYVTALKHSGAHEFAEQVIRRALDKKWDDELVELYGELDRADTPRLLGRVEGWLKSRGDDPALALAAGRLAMRSQQWDKARRFLEQSLRLEPHPEAYQAYGALLAQLGEAEDAAGAYRRGLALATGIGENTLPVLAAPQVEQATEPAADAAERS